MKGLKVVQKVAVILLIVDVMVISGYFIKIFYDKNNTKTDILIEDKIDSFGYVLDKKKSDYYKLLFKELKTILNNSAIDYNKYAETISKLFVADLYNLDDKVSSGDVGGRDFVYRDFLDSFLAIAKNSLYNSIKSNVYGDRVQDLPKVSSVSVQKISSNAFEYNNQTNEDAYYVDVIINYEKDLGYPSSCSLILVKNEDGILEVVSAK